MSTPPRGSKQGAPAAQERPGFRLTVEPDGRSWTARENLVDILERELLGPANGPEEILDGVPDSAYLVGRIAPVRLRAGGADPSQSDSDEAATDVGDAVDAAESRGVPLTAVDDSSASSDEDEVEDQPQKRGLMIPASMGLRFQIPAELAEFTVTSSWGTYEPVKEKQGYGTSEPDAAEVAASPIRRYQRVPHSIEKTIRVDDLTPLRTTEIVLKDKVVLRLDRYDDTERGCRQIEVALCNDRETPRKIPVEAWLYQTELSVSAADEAVFLPVNDALLDSRDEPDDELRRLRLQYRDRLEFAIGRTCSVAWEADKGARLASRVRTTWLPVSETPQTAAEEISSALLDMRRLQEASIEELRAGLEPIVSGYGTWLDGEERRASELPEHLRPEGQDAVTEARRVHQQLVAGLEHLLTDEEALRCFQFMNQVMADQRVQSQVAERRASRPDETIDEARKAVLAEKGAMAHSWRTFQLAFVLMQLPLLSEPAAEKRSGDLAKAQLLFFPTGGGKTEAYLGLAAYAFAIRRRQKFVDSSEGPLDGNCGVAVLMRYTLRLLTAQQFQRATALICAAEVARREDPKIWGSEPFRIGLWVGTDVSPKRYQEAAEQVAKANQGHGYRLTVLQIQRCPWCGTRVEARDVVADDTFRRIYVYCGDELAECPFSLGGDVAGGLPVLTVDEEIYRLAPAFVIATVDKFARLAREGEAASLFGHVSRKCERHGFVHPDSEYCNIKDGSKHPQKDEEHPAAAVNPATRLRPPDLVIQDELHLITGSLGTTVGLFEVAIDVMTDWRKSDGRPVRPLLVASTATARNAADQVRALYGRDVTIFPPQVLDAGNTFFSKETPVSEDTPGRRYVGISTTGVRLTTAEIRVAEVLMAGGQLLLDRSGHVADPYMTLVGYFSATRELAGMARYMSDDIQTGLAKGRPWSRLPRRSGTNYGSLHVAELTSRVASADITATLDQMAVAFHPGFDSTDGKRNLRTLREAKKQVPEREMSPFDVVLATSMLQVGVDVTRLGLMLVVGQPKNTAEYIQASSRVGRDPNRPGLVVSLGNWARPRDLAHFEQFRHYHETFYSQVEALSVTPFSVTSLERGLDGVLVSAARVLQAAKAGQGLGLSPENGAGRIGDEQPFAGQLIDALVLRIARAGDEDAAKRARDRLENRLDQWGKRRKHLADLRKSLVYERVTDDSVHDALMMSAENAKAGIDTRDAPPFVVANSMREVQPEINLLVSPIKERLAYREPDHAPKWQMPEETP